MIDIHSHLIFGVDDGASSLEESIRMMEAAQKHKVETIIATPHFRSGIFNNEGVFEKFEVLFTRAADFNIRLRLGNEVLGDDKILSLIKPKKSIDFNNSQYIMLELPYNASLEYAARMIYKIAAKDIKIILAHPERNRKIMKGFHAFNQLIHTAKCQVQVDAGSVVGVYGGFVKAAARQLLKIEAADYLASNAHSSVDYISILPAAVKKIYKLCNEGYASKLLKSNLPDIMTFGKGIEEYGRETG